MLPSAIRVSTWPFARPNEVAIEFSLGTPAQRVTLDILDAQANAVRSFAGVAGERPPERILNSVGEWVNGPDAGRKGSRRGERELMR